MDLNREQLEALKEIGNEYCPEHLSEVLFDFFAEVEKQLSDMERDEYMNHLEEERIINDEIRRFKESQ